MKIAHIINPVKIGPSSDLFKAQPITFESMRRARELAKGEIEVALLTTQYPEDHEIIPDYFTITPDLDRSVMDVGDFQKERKLPLIRDILERATTAVPDADFIIYTNVDIALLPHFYLFVNKKIEEGLEAFVINRRTIHKDFDMDTLAEAYSAIGDKHPGMDCFVIRRDLIDSFKLGDICIGANWIGRTMFTNLIVNCNRKELFKDEHLTFHIGEDGAWLVTDYSEFDIHNKSELYRIMEEFQQQVKDPGKQGELEEIKLFMDQYGATPPPSTEYNPSARTLFVKKIKKIGKVILGKD